ncbi:MAG: hypothetical protein GY724_17230 [Actinomycetia bacterium]|nr:hypothetical protein [Actinomycetes bacterium]MCP4224625.1 hypothetical protein [Actinomycetes bacterium]MCP5033877.1 hypothetical protein [Actinomycetes bacterium]
MTIDDDPVLASRARIAGWVSLGLRTGYGLFGLAMIIFFASTIFDLTRLTTGAMTFCLLVGSAILAPSLVFSYAIKAASRADRDGTW